MKILVDANIEARGKKAHILVSPIVARWAQVHPISYKYQYNMQTMQTMQNRAMLVLSRSRALGVHACVQYTCV